MEEAVDKGDCLFCDFLRVEIERGGRGGEGEQQYEQECNFHGDFLLYEDNWG